VDNIVHTYIHTNVDKHVHTFTRTYNTKNKDTYLSLTTHSDLHYPGYQFSTALCFLTPVHEADSNRAAFCEVLIYVTVLWQLLGASH